MKLNFEYRKIGWVFLAGLGCGAVVWGLSVPLTGFREPFDSPGHYYTVAMFVAGFSAALLAPRYWWVAVIGIYLGERIYAFVMLPETRVWLAFGFVVNLFVLTWLPSAAGAFSAYIFNQVRKRRSRPRT